MDKKITIIDGPPPTFELVNDLWPMSLVEGSEQVEVAKTTLRASNGAALVERCHRAWRKRQPIQLEFRSQDGLKQEAPIVAAQYKTTKDGDILWLWLRFASDGIELAMAYEDDVDDEDDDDNDPFDLSGS